MMRNLFFRLYLMLILTFIGLGWSLDKLYEQHAETEQVISDLDLHKGTLLLLNRELRRLPDESKSEYISALTSSFGYPVSLLNLAQLNVNLAAKNQQLSEEQIGYLSQGGQLSIIDDESGYGWFFQIHESTEHIILLGPIKLVSENEAALISMVSLAVLGLIVFIWVWPLSRGLVILTKAAQQFGDGNFSTRATYDIARPFIPVVERFNDMAERIQSLIRSHKELSHAVSHELRTPIARIRFAMEMTRELPDSDKREQYFDTMNDNIEELDGLVDELLTYARFDREKPKLQFNRQDIVELAKEVISGYEMTEHQLSFAVHSIDSEPVFAEIDYDAMSRVLDNLLRNAIRYAQSQIRVDVSQGKHRVLITVEDDGPGIPEENWDKLFEPFVRLDESRDRNSGGIGLGLAMVRRYMEWHDGEVNVANAEPQGAMFVLSFPVGRKGSAKH